MNHDVAHCLDYTKRCPSKCPKVELERDLRRYPALYLGQNFDYMHFSGTAICERKKEVSDEQVGR